MSLEVLLQQAKRPLLVCHVTPDGDAIGSLLGLGWAMKELDKHPTLACADPVPPDLAFLPGASDIVACARGDEDLIVALDCADAQRMGSLYDANTAAHVGLVNIDHHITNTGYGAAQLVEPKASSTAQIVYHLLRRLGWPLTPWAATCLLTGVITDTRSFRTSNTDAAALRTAAELVEAGAPLAEVNEQLNHGLSLGVIALWGRVLGQVHYEEGVVWAEISHETLVACGLDGSDTGGLVSFLASAREARAAVLLCEREPGRIEVGLRSVPGLDVSAVAKALGGGGHPQAAGCTLHGSLNAAHDRVALELKRVLHAYREPFAPSMGDSHVTRSLPLSSS